MNYTQSLFALLGWTGGTIHQVSDEIGVDSDILLHGKPSSTYTASDYMLGQSAFSTCSREWITDRLLPQYKGNADFFLGYMRAAYVESLNSAGI